MALTICIINITGAKYNRTGSTASMILTTLRKVTGKIIRVL